ncbi:MAG: hypothetical protein ABEJ98_04180, partial [Candidatus Nanohaloarchaea archaeon]
SIRRLTPPTNRKTPRNTDPQPQQIPRKNQQQVKLGVKMPIYLKEIAEFTRKSDTERELGDVLAGRFSDLEIDSVKEIRKLRGNH